MNDHHKIVIGILGMPDNSNTENLKQYLITNGITVNFIVYCKPSLRIQLKRFFRKLASSGIRSTIERIRYALFNIDNKISCDSIKKYYVSSHNSNECQQILLDNETDLLLLATDELVGKKILHSVKLAVLNAHPGWVPTYRGLGSFLFQMKDGFKPSVSVHKVDEGVDTGMVIIRKDLDTDFSKGVDFVENQICLLQRQLFVEVIRMFILHRVKYISTFEEPSNLFRGMNSKSKYSLDLKLKAGYALRSIG